MPISVVQSFKKIKALVGSPPLLANALQTSSKLVSSYALDDFTTRILMFFLIHFALHLSFLSLPHFRLLVKMERKLNVGILSLRQIWKSCRFLSFLLFLLSFSFFFCHGFLPAFNFRGANTYHLYFCCWCLVSHCYCGKSSGGSFLPKPHEGFLSGRKVGSSVFIC